MNQIRFHTFFTLAARRILFACLGTFAFCLALSSCQNVQPTAPVDAKTLREQATAATAAVILAPGDVVKLMFPGAAELTHSQKIRADGKISAPMIGEVHATGKTLASLRSELAGRYKTQLLNSEVIVTLESAGAPVVISGAVNKPGRLVFERPTTVLEAIMEAGGATMGGNLKKVHVIRVAEGQHRTQILDLRPALSGAATPAFYVKSGDVIFVPEKLF